MSKVYTEASDLASAARIIVDVTGAKHWDLVWRLVAAASRAKRPSVPRFIGYKDYSLKLSIIKAVRNFTGCGLKEAKDFTESIPCDIDSVSKYTNYYLVNDATRSAFIKELREAGAIIE